MIAERATALGGMAMGTARMAAQNTRLQRYPINIVESMGDRNLITERMATLAESTRQAAGRTEELHDMDTNDSFIEVS